MKPIQKAFLALVMIALASCASVPYEAADAPLDNTKAYIEQYRERGSWGYFLFCTVISVDNPQPDNACEQVERGTQLFVRISPGTKRLFLEVKDSPGSMFRAVGQSKVSLVAELKPNTMYAFSMNRFGNKIKVSVFDKKTGQTVSEKLEFDIKNPIKIPIIIPI